METDAGKQQSVAKRFGGRDQSRLKCLVTLRLRLEAQREASGRYPISDPFGSAARMSASGRPSSRRTMFVPRTSETTL